MSGRSLSVGWVEHGETWEKQGSSEGEFHHSTQLQSASNVDRLCGYLPCQALPWLWAESHDNKSHLFRTCKSNEE